MQSLFNQFSQVLGTTLLHSLWQGLIIYTVLRLFFLCFASASSNSKYNMALLALASSVLWPLITLMVEIGAHPIATPMMDTGTLALAYVPVVHNYPAVVTNSWSLAIDQYMPYLVITWFTGIALNSARLLFGWRNLYRIRQKVTASALLQSNVQNLSRLLNITKTVGVYVSEHIDVPCIMGYIKPVILMPAAVVTQFSADQIRSILAHELAHIRRNDYFVNVLQQLIGILFFFNPFTYLINRTIYQEREHCCDDLVLHIIGQPLIYAQTLLKLEESRQNDWQLALAATGKKYHLLNRIQRIMETKKQTGNIRHIIAAILLLVSGMGAIAWLNPEIKDGRVSISPIKQIAFSLPADDTTQKVGVKAKKATVKHKALIKPKPVIINDDLYNNPVLNKLSAEVEKHGEAIGKFYQSAEYLNLQKKMESLSANVDSFYNKPELKKLQESLDAKSAAFDKMSDAPEIKEVQKKIEELSNAQAAYFNNAEYSRLQKKFEAEGKWFEQENASKSPDFKAHSEALEKAGAALREYTHNPKQKEQQEQIRAFSKQIREYYDSPEYKKQREDIMQASKELRAAYQNTTIKQQQQQMRELGTQMRNYNNKPEIKREQEMLKQASLRLKAYTGSPAFKKLQEELRKNMNRNINLYNDQADTMRKAGK